jgi:hypothetical protein
MTCCNSLNLSHEVPTSDIYLEQGSQWRQTFKLKDKSGAYVNLAECLIRGDVRQTKDGPVIFSFDSSINEEDNEFTMTIPHTVTAALSTIGNKPNDPLSQFVFDWTLTDSLTEQYKILIGRIVINKETTRT